MTARLPSKFPRDASPTSSNTQNSKAGRLLFHLDATTWPVSLTEVRKTTMLLPLWCATTRVAKLLYAKQGLTACVPGRNLIAVAEGGLPNSIWAGAGKNMKGILTKKSATGAALASVEKGTHLDATKPNV